MKKLITLLTILMCATMSAQTPQYIDAGNTEVVGVVEDSISNPIDFLVLDAQNKFRKVSKDSLTTSVSWSEITGDQSDINLSGFTNDIGASVEWGDITGTLSNQTDLQIALDNKVAFPDLTWDVIVGDQSDINLSGFTNDIGASVEWGDITGTLSNQTDLQIALDNKVAFPDLTWDVIVGDQSDVSLSGFDNVISEDITINAGASGVTFDGSSGAHLTFTEDGIIQINRNGGSNVEITNASFSQYHITQRGGYEAPNLDADYAPKKYVDDEIGSLGTMSAESSADYTTTATLSSTSNGEGASLIGIEDAAGNFTATDVEDGLGELYEEIQDVREQEQKNTLQEYTVATLPTTPELGEQAIVTDADSPAWNTAVTGGGATTVVVYYDGTNWICH